MLREQRFVTCLRACVGVFLGGSRSLGSASGRSNAVAHGCDGRSGVWRIETPLRHWGEGRPEQDDVREHYPQQANSGKVRSSPNSTSSLPWSAVSSGGHLGGGVLSPVSSYCSSRTPAVWAHGHTLRPRVLGVLDHRAFPSVGDHHAVLTAVAS